MLHRAGGCPRPHDHAARAGLGADDLGAEDDPAARGAQRRHEDAVDAQAGDRGRERRHLEDRAAEARLELGVDLGPVPQPEHRREADALARAQPHGELRGDQRTDLRAVEGARQAEPVLVDALERQVELDGASRDAEAREVVRQQGRVEVLQLAQPHDTHRVVAPEIAPGHGDRGSAVGRAAPTALGRSMLRSRLPV